MDVLDRADLPFPHSLPEFQRLFPDDAACAAYLEKARWGDGFACPHCGTAGEPFHFENRPGVLRCRKCRSKSPLPSMTAANTVGRAGSRESSMYALAIMSLARSTISSRTADLPVELQGDGGERDGVIPAHFSRIVSGHTIEEALGRAKQARAAASFDMLGEAAHTANDAERYFAAYEAAITTLGRSTSGAEHTGFGVRVYPSGRKSYIVNYRAGDGGRKAPNKRVMLGRCEPTTRAAAGAATSGTTTAPPSPSARWMQSGRTAR